MFKTNRTGLSAKGISRRVVGLALVAACVLALLLPSAAFAGSATVVSIPDPALRAYLRVALAKPTGDILSTDMESLLTISAYNLGIVQLGGLEYATNAITIDLSQNAIVDTNPLKNLTNLTTLNLGENAISDLTPLQGLTNLTSLDLYINSISDVSKLHGLTKLKKLYLFQNTITDISPLASMTDMQDLTVSQNPGLTNLSPISVMVKMKHLNAGYNPIVDLRPLAPLKDLETLNLYGNETISDITPLAGLTKLNWLNISRNKIWDISALEHLNAPSGGMVICRNNWLDLAPGSAASVVVAGLEGKGYAVTSTPQEPGGSIMGSVVHSASRAPLSGVTMSLFTGPSAVTTASGGYRLGFAPTGLQTLRFSKPYFTPYETTITVVDATPYTVDATLTPYREPLTMKRMPGSSALTYKRRKGVARFTLSVTLSDRYGPRSGAVVWLMKSSNGKKWTTAYKLRTNSSGKASHAYVARKRSTTYYRWYAPTSVLNTTKFTTPQKVRIK